MYVDNGFSGTNTAHRPGFLKLIEDCRAGKIDMVITKAVSRFARNLMDCIKYVEELKILNPPVNVYFEQEKLDTGLQTSGVILIVLAMVAEEESHMKSEAMLLSLEWRFSRGRFLTPALFGYDKVEVPDGFGGKKKTLMVNPQQAKVVEWIYAMLVNGSTAEEIAGVLTELQIPTGGSNRVEDAAVYNTKYYIHIMRRSSMDEEKRIAYYVYQIEMPPEYESLFSSLASKAGLTIEELIVQYLHYAVAHPQEILKWKNDYDALPESEKQEYSRIKVKQIAPVYCDDRWLKQHGGA